MNNTNLHICKHTCSSETARTYHIHVNQWLHSKLAEITNMACNV